LILKMKPVDDVETALGTSCAVFQAACGRVVCVHSGGTVHRPCLSTAKGVTASVVQVGECLSVGIVVGTGSARHDAGSWIQSKSR
jgi:hypothetical protein